MKLAAVIIETRNIAFLGNIITDHLRYLPKNTPLHIFHSQQNEYLKNNFKKAKFILLPNSITLEDYNKLLTTPAFWEQFLKYDRVFVFQSDSRLLRKGIEVFMPYDYVGAPFRFQEHGGNGGCSLRNPAIMHKICTTYPYNVTYGNEDVYFCNIMHQHKIGNLINREKALLFGTESVFALGTFSYHAIDKWLTPQQCNLIRTQYEK